MISEFYITGARGGEMARQVGEYRLEGRLRRARRSYSRWASAVLTRVPRPAAPTHRKRIEPREA